MRRKLYLLMTHQSMMSPKPAVGKLSLTRGSHYPSPPREEASQAVRRWEELLERWDGDLASLRTVVADLKQLLLEQTTPNLSASKDGDEFRAEITQLRAALQSANAEKDIILRKYASVLAIQVGESAPLTSGGRGLAVEECNGIEGIIHAIHAEEKCLAALQSRTLEHANNLELLRGRLSETLARQKEAVEGERGLHTKMLPFINPSDTALLHSGGGSVRLTPSTESPGASPQGGLHLMPPRSTTGPPLQTVVVPSGGSPVGGLQKEKEMSNLRYHLEQLRQLHLLQQSQSLQSTGGVSGAGRDPSLCSPSTQRPSPVPPADALPSSPSVNILARLLSNATK